jgi:polysaccharide biosynthesis/export protein
MNPFKRWQVAICLLATACSGQKILPVAGAGAEVVDASVLPAPNPSDLRAGDRPYFIGPFDKLRIDVFGVEALSKQEVQADASGRLSFPLIGVVEAAGKTPGELAETIEERLRSRFIRDPQVTVNLMETVSQVITVDGEVKEPGLYPVVGRMTLMRAVATAKGVTEFAKLRSVAVFRKVNGREMAAIYDLRAIREGRYSDPEVYASDVVIVGNSQVRRIFRDILNAAPLLSTPLIILFQNR